MTNLLCGFLLVFLLADFHILPTSGSIRDGLYAVRNTISIAGAGTTANRGQGSGRAKRAPPPPPTLTATLYLEALAPKTQNELGQVVTNYYNWLPHSQWQIRRNGTVFWMGSQGNSRNVLTGTGYRFVTAQNGTFIIERVFAQGRIQCLRNNGQGRAVSFENCGGNLVFPLSPFRWEFCPINRPGGGSTGGQQQQPRPPAQPRPRINF